MTSELVRAWMDRDTSLREALENVLSRDPEDTATRLVALSTYYRLMTFVVSEKEEEEEDKREEFRRQLAYFVRLRDIEHCTTLTLCSRLFMRGPLAPLDFPRLAD